MRKDDADIKLGIQEAILKKVQGPLAYKVPEAGLGQPARVQGSVPWTSRGH